MKKIMFFGALMLGGLMMCNVANAQSGVQEAVDYCPIEQFNDGTALHGKGIGESRKQQMARSKARSAAMRELAEKVEVNIKSLAQDFEHSTSLTDDVDSEMIIEVSSTLSQRIVNQNMQGLKTVCEKGITYTNAKGVMLYKYFQVIEYDKEKLEKAVYDGLKNEGALKANMSLNEFKKDFDKVFSDKVE